jgi:hypothetical protein
MSARSTIPLSRTSSDFVYIQNHLVRVLTEIKDDLQAVSTKILWVSCRLNRSKETTPSPVFVGWVEDMDAINTRVANGYAFAPIELRFSDTHPSKLYLDCMKAPLGTVVPRDWKAIKADPTSQRVGEVFYKETNRRSMPIQVGKAYVGTLNAAFQGDPSNVDQNIKKVLTEWAQTSKSPLVKYITNNLDYSGPSHP